MKYRYYLLEWNTRERVWECRQIQASGRKDAESKKRADAVGNATVHLCRIPIASRSGSGDLPDRQILLNSKWRDIEALNLGTIRSEREGLRKFIREQMEHLPNRCAEYKKGFKYFLEMSLEYLEGNRYITIDWLHYQMKCLMGSTDCNPEYKSGASDAIDACCTSLGF